MSNFAAKFKNKETGETVYVLCVDDYFAHHVYGYLMPDGRVLNGKQMGEEGWERV